MQEFLPTLTVVAFLANPFNLNVEPETRSLQDAVRSLGLELHILHASSPSEIEAAFETLVGVRAGALVVSVDTFFTSSDDRFSSIARLNAVARYRGVPKIHALYEATYFAGLRKAGMPEE